MQPPLLVPMPQRLAFGEGVFIPRAGQFIRIQSAGLLAAAQVIQHALRQSTTLKWPIIAGSGGPAEGIAATIAIDTNLQPPQGYRLSIAPAGISIAAADPAGAFYAAQTLAQLLRLYPSRLPALDIHDHPDFPQRGVMLDISRDKVPTMDTLFALVDELAGLKINQLQLYTEHTFAYRGHEVVHARSSPITPEQILQLDAYCRERFIQLVPNQNSFGHMERWLRHPQYIHLAEAPDGYQSPWGRRDGPFSLCPTDPRALDLLTDLYDQLLPHFSSPLFNVGCDETYDIGQGRSQPQVQRLGRERIYLDFLLQIHNLIQQRGRTMQFWGDIILHKPELIPELPENVIALEWGYEANHPFDRDGALFAQSNIPFYVCPGTSSWLSITGRTDNALANLRSAAENGLKHGAIGYLNTDWGDCGHLQYLPISYLGFTAGAAYSWSLAASRDLDIPAALDAHIFRDRAGVMGRLAYALGNVHQAIDKHRPNATYLFWRLLAGPEREKEFDGIDAAQWMAAREAIESVIAPLDDARMDRPDAALIRDEFRNAAAMLRHACRRGLWKPDPSAESPIALTAEMAGIIGEHRRLWLKRNRPGGMEDSAHRLISRLADYT